MEIRWIFRPAKMHQKSRWKQGGFFDHRQYAEKSTWRRSGFLDYQNYIEKSTWKWRRNSSKNGPSTYRRNIHVKSTLIWLGVPVARAIDLHSNLAFLSRLKFWFAKKLKMNLRTAPTVRRFWNLSRQRKNSRCF